MLICGLKMWRKRVENATRRSNRRRRKSQRIWAAEMLEDRTLLSSVAVFDNGSFVDTSGGSFAESDNVQASLASLGHSVSTFTSIDASGINAALAGQHVLLIPEQERGNLVSALEPSARTAIQDFVSNGGGLIIHGFSNRADDFLNGVFGFSTFEARFNADPSFGRTSAAAGTEFADDPAFIPRNSGTAELLSGLPAGSKTIYTDGNGAAVALMPFGGGEIVYLGWDWFDAQPVGSQDGGWLQVLDSAVEEVSGATRVTSTVPADGSVVFSKPTEYIVNVSDPIDPGTLEAADFEVNGIDASGVAYTAGTTTITFTFASDPVMTQGLQTMHVAEGAFTSASEGEGVSEFNGTFRFDAVLMEVTSTDPADGSTALLPFTTLDLNFNEAYDLGSAEPGDFALNQGSVSAVSQVDADTLRLTLDGVTEEADGTLTVDMAAGAMTDVFGNPGAAFSGSYILDFGTVPYPVPLTPKDPLGSLIYDPTQSGIIDPAGDTDSFTVQVDAGQLFTVVVDSDGSLRPTVEVRNQDGDLLGSATAGAAGESAVLQNVPTHGQLGHIAPPSQTYTVTVAGADATTGGYTLQMILNAAVEDESHGGASNDTLATAQSLEPAFLPLHGSVEDDEAGRPERTAVLGTNEFAGYSQSITQIDRLHRDFGNFPPPFDFTGTPTATGDATLISDTIADLGSFFEFVDYFLEGTFLGRLHENGSGDYGHDVETLTIPKALINAAGADGTITITAVPNTAVNNFGTEVHIVTLQYPTGAGGDTFSFNLQAGESATVAVTVPGGGSLDLALLDAGGTELALGSGGADNVSSIISNFIATSSGTYYARITGGDDTDYSLLVTRNAGFDSEGNDDIASAQEVLSNEAAGRQWMLGHVDALPSLLAISGAGNTPSTLYALDPATGAVVNTIGATGFSHITSMDIHPITGEIYAVSNTPRQLLKIDPSDASVTVVGPTNAQIPDISFRSDGTLFGWVEFGPGSDDLATIDLATGAVTIIPSPIGTAATGVAFDSADNLYVKRGGFASPILFQVDPANGAVINSIFLVGGNPSNVLEFDSNDVLYSAFRSSRTGPSTLQTIDVSTGQVTNIGTSAGVGITALAFGPGGPDPDFYKIDVDEQTTLELETRAPAHRDGEFVNNLDPLVRLYDAAGNLVASNDNGAPDGRNARLRYRVPAGAGGTYFVEVTASDATAEPTVGEYTLAVMQATGELPAFQVTATDPSDGQRLRGPTTQMTVDFNDTLLLTSLDASDLTVNGTAATGFTVVDADTVVFDLPTLSEGLHNVEIAGIQDIQNTPLETFNLTFFEDLTAPRVVDISIQEDEVVTISDVTHDLTYTVTFSEPMNTTNLDNSDFNLHGVFLNVNYTPASAGYDATGTVLTLNYTVPEDRYNLILFSGDGRFEDTAEPNGWNLDGEPVAFPIPPNESGNGVEGGNFVVNFDLDIGTAAYPTPLTPKSPLGSLIYDPQVSGIISPSGDTDTYTINVDAGQTITVLADPSASLRPTVELRDPSDAVVGTATAAANGEDAVIQTVATVAGIYTINVGGDGGTTGQFSLQVTLNAALESESHDGSSNDTAATAQDINGSFVPLLKGATRGAVLGRTDTTVVPIVTEDFESGSLPGSFTTSSTGNGRIQVTSPGGSGNSSSFALIMDNSTFGGFSRNEAIMTVDLTGVTSARLSFRHAEFGDENHFLPLNFTGSVNGDGVAISDDGVNWRTILNAPQSSPNGDWEFFSTDLAAEAAAAGMTLGPNFKIKFQQFDNFPRFSDGRGYDNIVIGVPTPDVYSFTVGANERVTLALDSQTSGNVDLELLDTDGTTVLATGSTAQTNVDEMIYNFGPLAAGTYYARISGGTGTPYSLVVTRDAVFDAEDNDDFASAQSFGGLEVASGHVGSPKQVIENGSFETGNFTGWTINTTGSPFRPWQVTGAGFGDGFGMAATSPQDGSFVAWNGFDGSGPMEFTMFQDVTLPANAFELQWQNRIQWNFTLGGFASEPRIFEVQLRDPADSSVLSTLFSFSTGTQDVNPTGDTGWQTHTADVSSFAGSTVRLFFREEIPQSFTGPGQVEIDAISLTLPDEDWYSFTANAGDSIFLNTATPADGPGEFVNTLDPRIELYDPSGNLVASGTAVADGRNEEIDVTAAVAGEYRVRVTAENGTSGEYVLDPVSSSAESTLVTTTAGPAVGDGPRFGQAEDYIVMAPRLAPGTAVDLIFRSVRDAGSKGTEIGRAVLSLQGPRSGDNSQGIGTDTEQRQAPYHDAAMPRSDIVSPFATDETEESDTGDFSADSSDPRDTFADRTDEEAATLDRLFADLQNDLLEDLLIPAR